MALRVDLIDRSFEPRPARPATAAKRTLFSECGSLIVALRPAILLQLKATDHAAEGLSLSEFMAGLARRGREETGVIIPVTDAEAFIRGSADAGVIRIIS